MKFEDDCDYLVSPFRDYRQLTRQKTSQPTSLVLRVRMAFANGNPGSDSMSSRPLIGRLDVAAFSQLIRPSFPPFRGTELRGMTGQENPTGEKTWCFFLRAPISGLSD
jgi:hypothetical protein